MEFEWDETKARSNRLKHGVTFNEAEQAFDDQSAIEFLDEMNSESEVRYQIIALSPLRLLFVAFTVRGETIRIISARKANAEQTRIYNEYNR